MSPTAKKPKNVKKSKKAKKVKNKFEKAKKSKKQKSKKLPISAPPPKFVVRLLHHVRHKKTHSQSISAVANSGSHTSDTTKVLDKLLFWY